MDLRLKPLVLLCFFGIWLGGLWHFYNITKGFANVATLVDGIVILTGGNDRIKSGLEQTSALKAKRVLVSGVPKSVKITTFQAIQLQGYPHILEQIDIGYGAVNTFSNALEAAVWVRNHQFRSIALVTSRFHMPRSLWLLKKAMTDIAITSIVVDANDSTFLHLLKEYHKYYLTKWVSTFLFDQEVEGVTL